MTNESNINKLYTITTNDLLCPYAETLELLFYIIIHNSTSKCILYYLSKDINRFLCPHVVTPTIFCREIDIFEDSAMKYTSNHSQKVPGTF